MSNEGGLWDDSALTNAFDQAMTKFKKMHVKGYGETSKVNEQGGEASSGMIVTDNERMYISLADHSSIEPNDLSRQPFKASECEADNLPVAKENETLDSHVPEEYAQVPNGISSQDHTQSYPNTQGHEEYDLLVKQYYELEEKRQKVWEKLQQYGQWDYSNPEGTSSSCTLWPAVSASQAQYSSSQACYPAFAISCCPYASQCSATSCCFPTYAGPSANPSAAAGSQPLPNDADIVKKGMEAAEKALCQLRKEASECKIDEQSCSIREPSMNGETDLSEVLNAWYSAGFYTAKYLTEKSLAKTVSD